MRIDIDDAIDRLQCMEKEIVILKHLPRELKKSMEKDKRLLRNLVTVINSLRSLKKYDFEWNA